MVKSKARNILKMATVALLLATLTLFPFAVSIAQNNNDVQPSITLEKYFSFDGTNWLMYTSPNGSFVVIGPYVVTGTPVQYKFVIKNNSSGALTDLSLIDNQFGNLGTQINPNIPSSINSGATFEGILSGKFVSTGQHYNEATVSAVYAVYTDYEQIIEAKAEAYYFGYNPQPGPMISIKKSVSVDGGATWQDADTIITGPQVQAGSTLQFKFLITNSGSVPLTGLNLTDDKFDLSGFSLPGVLLPGLSSTHVLPNITAVTGQHINKAKITAVSAVYKVYQVTDSDLAHYYGYTPQFVPRPALVVKKYISIDNSLTWLDAETSPGPSVAVGSTLKFKFLITNTGNVTLTNLTLADNVYNLGIIALPASLLPGASFEHIHTTTAASGQHSNTSTATGKFGTITVSDTDKAHYHTTGIVSPSINIKKYVSVNNGTTWLDAETAPGPDATVGSPVKFKFLITNTGNVTLTNLTLADNVYNLGIIALPASLLPGASFEHIHTTTATSGEHSNTGSATGKLGQTTVSDTDKAHYKGITTSAPAIEVTKYVSVDGGKTWIHAPSPKGPEAVVSTEVQFKFIIKNTGNETLTDLTLTDSVFNHLLKPTLPASLAPGAIFEYVLKDITASASQHSNKATATGKFGQTTLTDTDMAHYYGVTPVTPKPPVKPTPPTDGKPSGVLMASVALLSGLIALAKNKRWLGLARKGKH